MSGKIKEYPIMNLDFKKAFEQLSDKEKLYTYYTNQACWLGRPILLFQISYETPALYVVLQKFFSSFQPFSELKKSILEKGKGEVSEEDYTNFTNFSAKFYSNCGNYTSFGKKKFIPDIKIEKFEKILSLSSAYSEIEPIWKKVKEIVYNDSKEFSTLNLEEKGGKNFYYIGEIKESEIQKVDKLLHDKKISNLNTRILKTKDGKYNVLVGSIDEKTEVLDKDTSLIYGEFSPFLKEINKNLEEAKKYCANETQVKMMQYYIDSFKTGSVDAHKDSQRQWVQDRLPVVEMNMGWIETYIDPLGVRGYYEGWVALTDKEKSKQFNELVANAPNLLDTFPWSKDFEKDKFSSPDFIALDIVGFACDGCPIGINIPNYSDVQEEVGFKNISLSNAYPSFDAKNLQWITEKDIEILHKHGKDSLIMQVGGHELLGHGSGKLLRKNEDGSFNFDIEKVKNPLTGGKIEKYYEGTQTFEQVFTSIGRSMEECRADLAGLFFGYDKKVHKIFGANEADYEDIIYSMYLIHFRKGIIGLTFFNADNKQWGQAHVQDAFVITSFFLDKQEKGKEILTVTLDEEKKSFSIEVNKQNLMADGKKITSEILLNLHIWKCTGDVKSASDFYHKYSQVDDKFLKIRKILLENEKERRLELFYNLKLEGEKVSIVDYPTTIEGILQSNVERFPKAYEKDILDEWTKYQ